MQEKHWYLDIFTNEEYVIGLLVLLQC